MNSLNVKFINLNSEIMEGIQYVTDENNKKIAVQLSYEVYGEYLEDLIDGLIAESRKDDEKISLEELTEELQKEGLLEKWHTKL